MGTLASSLLAKDIHLTLRSGNSADALEEVLSGLRNDRRVKDWDILRSSLVNGSPIDCGPGENGMIILHHRRTPGITSMVLAAGRFPSGISVEGCTALLRMVFVAAVPESLNNEYLRIIGAVSRICGNPESFERLMGAADSAEFLHILEEGCRR
jgi:mannitol/fructose-specific phosphotransferase system IIA component (Ntr-type)